MTEALWEGQNRLVAIDIETTGKRTPTLADIRKAPKAFRQPGVVIEIGCIELKREGDNWVKGEIWETKVNPDAPLHPDSIKIHGIKPGDLKNAPRFKEIAESLKAFIGDSMLLAHAYRNEMDFLNYEYARAGFAEWGELTFPDELFICTQEMSHEMFPRASGSLDALLDRLWIDRSDRFDRHGALLDAELTAEAFLKMAYGDVNEDDEPRAATFD